MPVKRFQITMADLQEADRWSRTNRPIPRAMLRGLKAGCIVWEQARDAVIFSPEDRDDTATVALPTFLADIMTLYEHGQPVMTPIDFKLDVPQRFL